jgi:hypothetical protein
VLANIMTQSCPDFLPHCFILKTIHTASSSHQWCAKRCAGYPHQCPLCTCLCAWGLDACLHRGKQNGMKLTLTSFLELERGYHFLISCLLNGSQIDD